MRIERETGEIQNSADIEIVGSGGIGEKARELVKKTPILRDLGFHTPRRIVLAEGYFDEFFQRNGFGRTLKDVPIEENTGANIQRGSLTSNEFTVLQKIAHSYGNTPLVIRSSAEGDARGTGTYKSIFVENRMTSVRKAVQQVLASYFSRDAVAFRRDAKTGEGFGIIVEPIIGQDLDHCIAPLLSGFGYTSTSRGEGYINAVPGLGGGVESRDGERLTKSAVLEYQGSLLEYLYEERQQMFRGWKTKRGSALLRTDRSGMSDGYSATAYFPSTSYRKQAEIAPTSIYLEGELRRAFGDINLLPLFSMTEKMESLMGKPQYFEWAMTFENGKPVYWITQIADVSKRLDLIDFENLGEVLLMGHTVTGSGIKECSKIANCWNPDDVPRLNRFNETNKDYVLLYSSRLTSAGVGINRKLRYGDFSNASVFLEIQDAQHLGNPVAHLGGQLDLTGKLFAVLDYDAEVPPNWDKLHNGELDEEGLRVYQGDVKVVSSERQNRLVAYIKERKD